jgi:hypothetical protein
MNDPIVEEVRRARATIAARHGDDLHRIAEDARRRQGADRHPGGLVRSGRDRGTRQRVARSRARALTLPLSFPKLANRFGNVPAVLKLRFPPPTLPHSRPLARRVRPLQRRRPGEHRESNAAKLSWKFL